MILEVDFCGTNISLDGIEDIPCLCKVKGNEFVVEFVSTYNASLNHAEGKLKDWSLKALNTRVPSRAGGEYTYYEHGLISIEKTDEKIYRVLSLKLFYNDFGWLPFIENGEYATPKQFWDDEPDWLP